MIKLNVIDFIISLCLEPFEYDVVLLVTYLQFHCVEYRSEASVGHEATLALVLVLEEGLDQEALMAHEPAKTLKAGVKEGLLTFFEDVLWVEDRGRVETDGLF